MQCLYNTIPKRSNKYVTKNKGNETDAEDVFQEGILVLYRKIRNNEYEMLKAFDAYFFVICKRIWLKKLSRLYSKEDLIDTLPENALGVEESLIDDFVTDDILKMGLYQEHFLQLSKQCQELLTLFNKKVPFSKITSIMGFINEAYAKNRKYACKEFLKKRIKKDPLFKKFLENEK